VRPQPKHEPAETAESLRLKVREYERWFRSLDEQMRVLERERQKLSAVLNHTDAGFLVLDASLRVVWANEEFNRRFGAATHPGSLLGSLCHEVLCRDEMLCDQCPAKRPLASGSVAHHELRLEIDGQTRHIYATAMPILSPSAEVEETIVMLQDVSDLEVLRRSQAELRKSEERFRSIFLNAAAGMATFTPDGRFMQANPALCRFLGYDEAELLTRRIADITHPDDLAETLRLVDEARSGKRTSLEMEKRYIRKDGSSVWGHTSAAWLSTPDGEPIYSIALVQDITERKRAEQALRESEEQLRQAQKLEAIGTLAGGLAHDFNNILTGILGHAEMLKASARPGDNVHRAADVIEKAGRRAADLTRQLLGFARKGKEQNTPVSVHERIREVIALLSHAIDKKINIREELAAAHAYVLGDPVQVQQIILNLALNARDAMPDGGTLTLKTEDRMLGEHTCRHHRGAVPGRFIIVTVSDTGHGIPEKILGRIFEPFFTTKGPGLGTGMGLATAYGIVENHGGWFEVDSRVDEGTTFRIFLPATDRSVAETPPGNRAAAPGMGRILVVDDEEIVRDVATEFLTHLGYQVVTASDGREAVDYYTSHADEIDLVIVDMIMPRMGGRDCFLALKALNPSIRAILSSGYGFNVAAQEMIEAGMLSFVQKPYDLLEFSEAITSALNR